MSSEFYINGRRERRLVSSKSHPSSELILDRPLSASLKERHANKQGFADFAGANTADSRQQVQAEGSPP